MVRIPVSITLPVTRCDWKSISRPASTRSVPGPASSIVAGWASPKILALISRPAIRLVMSAAVKFSPKNGRSRMSRPALNLRRGVGDQADLLERAPRIYRIAGDDVARGECRLQAIGDAAVERIDLDRIGRTILDQRGIVGLDRRKQRDPAGRERGARPGRQDAGADGVIELAEHVAEYIAHCRERYYADCRATKIVARDQGDCHRNRPIGNDRQGAGGGGIEAAAVINGDAAIERHQVERGRQEQTGHAGSRIESPAARRTGPLSQAEQAGLDDQRIERQRAAARLHGNAAVQTHVVIKGIRLAVSAGFLPI